MKRNEKIALVVGLIFYTGILGAYISAPFAGTYLYDRLQFGVAPEGPVGVNVAQKWRVTIKDGLAGTDLTVDTAKCLVNGQPIGDPSKNAGYLESEQTVRTGDLVQLEIDESGYYSIVHEFTVPMLGELPGGTTYYMLSAAEMYATAHADATLSATYAGTDIDAANWDISASTEYSGVTITLDISMANMDNKAYGPEKYTEIVGDKDTMGKFWKVDCNDCVMQLHTPLQRHHHQRCQTGGCAPHDGVDDLCGWLGLPSDL